MVNWNTDILNKFIAPEIGSFTDADIIDLREDHKEHPYWLSNHFLNNALRNSFKEPYRQYAINFIFRSQMAFDYYHQARKKTLEYLIGNEPTNPKVSKYYEAISLWELVFINWSICLDIVKVMDGNNIFEKGDGSKEQRAYDIYNVIKHYGSKIRNETIKNDLTIPMWLSNNGFCSVSNSLTYSELAGLIKDAAKIADKIQDPQGFYESNKTN